MSQQTRRGRFEEQLRALQSDISHLAEKLATPATSSNTEPINVNSDRGVTSHNNITSLGSDQRTAIGNATTNYHDQVCCNLYYRVNGFQ